ncbi:MAG: thioredoxin [Rhodospirillales bacterium]|nr:thioredoxin [Rhodospirillales bacterium]
MATIELTVENFEATITENDMVVIDFWAEWCGPCKMFGPTFEKVSGNHEGVVFAKCDTESQQQIAAQFGIQSIPTLAIMRDKVLLFSQPGAVPENALDDIVTQAKNLDMNDVHAKIAEEQAKQVPAND